jgi:PAS domain S-box-containing protein
MSDKTKKKDNEELLKEVADLRSRLQEVEDTLLAIRSGEIDALLVEGEAGHQVFTLKGAEHGYRLFVEGMHEGAVTLRADGLILHCNAQFASLLELPLTKVIGGNFLDYIRRFLEGKLDRRQEFELRSQSGKFIPVVLAISAGLVEEASGAMCLIVTDIREQKHLEQLQQTKQALEQSQDQLKLALETARLGSWKFDLASGNIECSPQCLANLGQPSDYQLTEEKLFAMMHPDDRAPMRARIELSLKESLAFENEYRIHWPDGSLHWIVASGRVLHNDAGVPFHMVGVSLDNTIHKMAEDSLKESEYRFRTLAEAIPQLSWTCLPDGNCDYLSQQWIDYTGIPLEEQLGLKWLSVLHPDDREKTAQVWRAAVETGGEYDLEFRIRGADERYRWFKTRGTPVRDGEKRIVRWFGTCTEVEDIVQARQILNRDNAQLEALVKSRTASLNETTEQLNAFCYSVAHDLRAPLRAQQGYARIILEDYGDQIGDTGKQFAQRIVSAAEKLEKLVHDLLSHVSISRGNQPLGKVEIAATVAQARADTADSIRTGGAHVEIGPVEGFVTAHGPSLNLIVANLLSNALKYTKPDVPARIKIWSEILEGKVRLWVEDNGIGIKPEYHEKIFGVFQRLHTPEVYPGTGIGLALVRKGIERMGGTTGVNSEPGVGSRFWIELPRFDDSASA